jgi:5-(carboxyamino)imidazole ribonucleotide synthase
VTASPPAGSGDGDDAGDPATVDLRPAVESAAHLHWYGKRRLRPLRKMGHVTATGDAVADPLATVRAVREETGFR